MTLDRREFLRRLAAGSALAATPALLQGCAAPQAQIAVDTPVLDNPFVSWFGLDDVSVGRIMSTLASRGADIADAFFELTTRSSIVFENGNVAASGTDSRRGVGLRVVRDGRVEFANSEDLRLPALLALARTVAGGAGDATPWALQVAEPGGLYAIDRSWTDVTRADRLQLLEQVDERTRAADPAIESVTLRWEDSEQTVMIATLDGQIVTDVRPLTRLSVVTTAARQGVRQSGFSSLAARAGLDWYTDERIEALVAEAVDRTLVQFEARRAPAGDMPVILAGGTSGVLLHEALGHSLEGDLVDDSPFAGQVGSRVAESFITIVDDARLPQEPGSLNVDDEGHETGRNVLIEDGILKGCVHDRLSARASGAATTGSGRRESFRHAPMPRMTCTHMLDGPHTRDEIVAAVGDGVLCETFLGGRAELGAGGFRFEVKNGWLVQDGKITAPTKDFTIAGNGAEMLRNITMVANDSRMDRGGWLCGKNGQTVPVSQGMPTVLVSALTVS